MYNNYLTTLLPLITGMVIKLYDDINDNKLLKPYKSKFLTEVLKGLTVVLLTLLALRDPLFIYLLYSWFCISYVIDPIAYKDDHEKSFFIVFLFLFLFLDNSKIKIHDYKIIDFSSILITLFITYIESKAYSEEYSIKKLIARTISIFVIFYLYYYILPISKLNSSFILCSLGYTIVSVIVQYYSVFIHDHSKRCKKCVKKCKGVKKCKKV